MRVPVPPVGSDLKGSGTFAPSSVAKTGATLPLENFAVLRSGTVLQALFELPLRQQSEF
jgi:hypothetical protein